MGLFAAAGMARIRPSQCESRVGGRNRGADIHTCRGAVRFRTVYLNYTYYVNILEDAYGC